METSTLYFLIAFATLTCLTVKQAVAVDCTLENTTELKCETTDNSGDCELAEEDLAISRLERVVELDVTKENQKNHSKFVVTWKAPSISDLNCTTGYVLKVYRAKLPKEIELCRYMNITRIGPLTESAADLVFKYEIEERLIQSSMLYRVDVYALPFSKYEYGSFSTFFFSNKD